MTQRFDLNRAMTHRIAAFLLSYPDTELSAMLPTLRTAAVCLTAPTGTPLVELIDDLRQTPLLAAQQHYVDTFDMRRRCSLYLTYWTTGDTRNRGQAILEVKRLYREAGVIPAEEELPDHLTVVLEFAGTTNQTVGTALLLQHHAGLTLLTSALREQGSRYVLALDAVLATLPEPTETTLRAAAQIATTGPPHETVGITPYRAGADQTGGRR
ncbi:nitrate reductase molybdenum cofactor assembly chaperone [Saccharopolyspora phatthalungensis]|uniref:Nitrate reductase delta subunit n=1 Tax=Saccharopolyspora phatthalungensis TaxID=664693 RepID=A0A840QCM8_9PSEU|nr:nitrate reductase molybdenum cofactor assembly chaperone [Saccharopolyspora phatthalungensis]MBB5157540.1 nitrate reductase delta subunit [Saccharopolyspora phatthalungensis]